MNPSDTTLRYQTLRDYLPPLRRRWWVVVAITLLAIGLSVVYSSLKTPSYDASAKLRFVDETADFGLVGLASVPQRTTNELAQASAQTVTGPAVLDAVKAQLRTPLSTGDLKKSLSATVDPTSNLVAVNASSPHPEFAAALANAVAATVTANAAKAASARYASASHILAARLRATHDPTARALVAQDLSRLQTLATVARPARIDEHALVPKSPSSPKPLLYGFLAGFLGLMAGVAAALVGESFDRRLRSASEIQDEIGLPLLGHVRSESLGRSDEFAAAVGDGTGAQAAEAFRIVRQNLRFLDVEAPQRTVLVTSAAPAEGKTTVAVGLALASAAAGKLTLLVECDLRRPVLAARLGLRPAPGLADYIAGGVKPEEIIQIVPAGPSPNGAPGPTSQRRELVCITAGTPSPQPAELLGATSFASFLAAVIEVYDLVVLDTCPLLPVVDTLELLPQVDGIVLCVRAGQTTRDQALAATTAIEHFPPKPTGLVVTGTTRQSDGYYEYGYSSDATAVRHVGRGRRPAETGAADRSG